MEAIKYYVQGAFQGVKVTPEVLEQQEELIADLTAKVGDLVAQGKYEDEALGVAIASVGDLSVLVSEFEPVEELADKIPTASVYAARLDLHVIAISASIGAAVMIASTALGAWTDLVHPGAGFSLLAVLAAGIWWLRGRTCATGNRRMLSRLATSSTRHAFARHCSYGRVSRLVLSCSTL